jgi:hypothetical protein
MFSTFIPAFAIAYTFYCLLPPASCSPDVSSSVRTCDLFFALALL